LAYAQYCSIILYRQCAVPVVREKRIARLHGDRRALAPIAPPQCPSPSFYSGPFASARQHLAQNRFWPYPTPISLGRGMAREITVSFPAHCIAEISASWFYHAIAQFLFGGREQRDPLRVRPRLARGAGRLWGCPGLQAPPVSDSAAPTCPEAFCALPSWQCSSCLETRVRSGYVGQGAYQFTIGRSARLLSRWQFRSAHHGQAINGRCRLVGA
jgi:hypothetical protein